MMSTATRTTNDHKSANPDLVVRDANGAVYTARYDQVNGMLISCISENALGHPNLSGRVLWCVGYRLG
jgi:hypothetical protein